MGGADSRVGRFYVENARWLAAGAVLTFASSFGQTYFISLFAGEIKSVYGLSDGGWGSIYTLATMCSAAALFHFGKLADTVPFGRLAAGIALAYALVALGMALNSALWLLPLLVFGLRFCGQGMMGHIAITAMGRWFKAHRGRAVAVAGLGFSLAEAVLPAVIVLAIAVLGWRMTWGVVALVLALGFMPLFAWLLAQGRQPRGYAEHDVTAGLGGRHWERRHVLSHWAFWAMIPGVLTPPFIGTVIFFHQVHISETKGWPLVDMALGYPVYAGLTVASVLVTGWLVDRLGASRLLPVFLLPMGAGIALIGPGETTVAWFAALALIGVTQGMSQAIWGAFWPELYGTRHLGGIRAMAYTVMVFSTAIGPGITGLLIDAGISFPKQGLAMALCCLGASVLFFVITRRLAAEPGLG